jgi:EAL and modified HD-GYP domain-containing signal transduction protein
VTAERAACNVARSPPPGFKLAEGRPKTKDMSDHATPRVLLARQPIFDAKLELVAYELLFRSGGEEVATIVDPDKATATVVTNAFVELGLERVVGSTPAWVNISRTYLSDRLALILPNDRVALEVLEPHAATPDVLADLDELRAAGYELVLDDFVFEPGLAPLVERVDVVKLDVLALLSDELAAQVRMLRRHPVRLVAEKVETREKFLECMRLGFDLFQGYFFCKPEAVKGQVMTPNRLALLELVAALQGEDVAISDLERLISRDVSLSYRLLRYVNSAYFGVSKTVDSISRAVMMLGLANVRRWATMTLLSSIDDKPAALVTTALVRGRLCELLGDHLGHEDGDELFTLGLFSVLDALLDIPMSMVVDSIPFSEEMRLALIAHGGPNGEILRTVVEWERGDAGAGEDPAPPVVPVDDLVELYAEAVEWADRTAAELVGERAEATSATSAAA